MPTLFYICAGVVFYTYLMYPMIVYCCARITPKAVEHGLPPVANVSVVVVGYREGYRITEKIAALLAESGGGGLIGQLILVLDGIGASPNSLSESIVDARVQIKLLDRNCGKAFAISEGVALARHEIVVFADVRQRWNQDALPVLVEGFRDGSVGAVSGELVLELDEGIAGGVGLYWKYEKWLRLNESRFNSVIGVTGAICAVRRSLFEPVPKGAILDDVYWPMKVAMKGFRVLHEPRAIAYDRLPSRAGEEFQRKVRTLCGNFQLMAWLPELLFPWKNRLWWQFVSHKLLRLTVPWALIGGYMSSAFSPGIICQSAFWAQSIVYGTIGLALASARMRRVRLISAAAAFLLLNSAAWIAFWVWLLGRERLAWTTIKYDDGSVPESSSKQ